MEQTIEVIEPLTGTQKFAEEIIESVKEVKKTKEELRREGLHKLKEKESKILESLRQANYRGLESSCYTEMDAFTDMVLKQISTGVLIEGSAGTGKTFRVINRALSYGAEDMDYTDSYTTPQALYAWMYKNKDKKALIIDDVAGFMNNDKVLAFLKGALWEVNGKRLINYMTTKPIKDEYGDDVPNRFEMKAGIIIITNYLNKKNPHIQAVLSRINYCKVEIPRDELLKIMEQITKKGYQGLTIEECYEVFNYLKEKTSESVVNLNIRNLFKAFQFKLYSKESKQPELWKKLTLAMLEKDELIALVETLIEDDSLKTDEERVAKLHEMTGKSRATFYRIKKQLGVSNEEH